MKRLSEMLLDFSTEIDWPQPNPDIRVVTMIAPCCAAGKNRLTWSSAGES
jgi:hypothetical protein